MRNPFTLTIAQGSDFCNRTREKDLLCKNMRSGIHTVMYAPRRYGKSSLAAEVSTMLDDMTCITVDLFSITSPEDVAEKIYRGIVNALGGRAADKAAVASRIVSFFKRLRLSLEINPATTLPEFSVSLGQENAEAHLEEVITSLDRYCADEGIRVCLILDEFQEICELKERNKIEALLRGGMQTIKHVSFLMMGSRRTILRDMFEDKKRPFYKSSYVLPLSKIPAEEFVAFLIGKYTTHNKMLSEDEAREMISFADSYPYYVQKLAMIHFDLMGDHPDALAYAKAQLIEMEATDYEGIFLGLTHHQKRLLRAVAKGKPANIYSQGFLVAHRLGSQGGVQTSLAKLTRLDLVERKDDVWRVVDPVLEKWLVAVG